MPKRKYQKPLAIDLPFDEALERFAQADPDETREAMGHDIAAAKTTKGQAIEDLMLAFENAAHHDDQGEFWYARELRDLLGYASWEKFQPPITKAKAACQEMGEAVDDHFHHVVKMMPLGKGAQREVPDIELTRTACYWIAQNGDPTKRPEIAAAQTYFAIQTRRQELADDAARQLTNDEKRVFLRDKLKEHNRLLAEAAATAGVSNFKNFNGAGLKGLYGGLNQAQVVRRKQLPAKSNHLDYAPHSELAANYFKATQAEEILKRSGHVGQRAAEAVHKKVGEDVRDLIRKQGNTLPEDVKPEDHIKDVRKRVKGSEPKKLEKKG